MKRINLGSFTKEETTQLVLDCFECLAEEDIMEIFIKYIVDNSIDLDDYLP